MEYIAELVPKLQFGNQRSFHQLFLVFFVSFVRFVVFDFFFSWIMTQHWEQCQRERLDHERIACTYLLDTERTLAREKEGKM